jgi:hypothetical protein
LTLLLITLVPVTLLLIAAIIYVRVQVGKVTSRLDRVFVAELRRSLRREVKIGRVTSQPFGRLVIYDLSISDGPTFSSGTLLSAPRVDVRYSWVGLLRRVPPIQTVRSITLTRPSVRLTRSLSGWNVSELFKPPPGPPHPPFTGTIFLVKGRALIRDFLSGPPRERPATIRAFNIDGDFDMSKQPFMTFGAVMASDRAAKVEVSGRYHNKRKSIDIVVSAIGADAVYWTAYRQTLQPFHVTGGRFDARATIARTFSRTRQAQWTYVAAGIAKRVTASLPQLASPFTDVSGAVEFSNDLATIDLKGSIAGTSLGAKGAITLAPRKNLRLAIQSDAVNFGALARTVRAGGQLGQVRLAGVGSTRLLLVGWSPDFVVKGSVHVPRVGAAGYQAADIDVSGTYAKGIVSVSGATGRALGGRITVDGSVDVRKAGYFVDLSGFARGVRLQSVAPLMRAGLSGVGDVKFAVFGPASGPSVTASAKVARGNLRNLAFSQASGTVQILNGKVIARDVTASLSGGVARASGSVTQSRLDLQLTALGVDVGRLLTSLDLKGYQGIAYFRGRVSGSTADPTVAGNIEVFNGRAGPIDFEYARGHIAGNKTAIALTETTLKRYPTEVTASGRILDIMGGSPHVELQMEVKDADVGELGKTLNIPVQASGKLSGWFTVTGAIANPAISGSFSLANGSVSGYAIASASGQIVYADGGVTLTNLIARTDGATVNANGSMSPKGELAGSFSAQDLPLSTINQGVKPYLELAGSVDVTGSIDGTFIAPRMEMEVAATGITINGQKFNNLAGVASYDGVTAKLTDAKLELGNETLRIKSFTYNMEESFVNLAASVENGRVERLLSMTLSSPYLASPEGQRLRSIILRIPQPVKGGVDAKITASGPIDQLKGELQASAVNASVGDQKIDSLEVSVSSDQGHVKLDRFAAVSGDLNLTATGDILKNDRLDLEIEAYNVDLKLLQPLTGISDVTGVATISAVVQGPIREPAIQASAEIVSPSIHGVKFDRIRASQILVTSNQLELSDVIFTKDTYRGLLVGTLPWDWSSLTVPKDKPLSLHAELDKQSLAILSVLTSAVDVKGTSGTIDANLDIQGTMNLPDLTGGLVITDGALDLRAFSTSSSQGPGDFKNIQAKLTFVQGDISVEKLTGESSKGGTFTASGKISLANFPDGPVDLKFNTDKLVVSEQNLSGGYNETVAAKLTVGITATGSVKEPLISGSVFVADGQVKIPAAKQAVKTEPIVFSINPKFDITATAGNNVWIYNPRLSAMVKGSGSVMGSLNSPLIRATVVVQRGNIRLPTARPELRRGGTIGVVFAPPEPTQVVLDLQATASTAARSSLGFARRYDIVMDVRGPLDNLSIDARSSPPGLTRDQIFAMLGHVPGIMAPGDIVLEQELADIFTATIVPEVFSPLESAFAQAFGLEQFRLEFGLQAPVAVYLSRHLFGNFYASYWQTVSGNQQQFRASLSYRLTDRLQLSIITTDQPDIIGEVEGTLRF